MLATGSTSSSTSPLTSPPSPSTSASTSPRLPVPLSSIPNPTDTTTSSFLTPSTALTLPPAPTALLQTLLSHLSHFRSSYGYLPALGLAGGLAGAASRTVVSPLERLKIIFQVQGPERAGYVGIGPSLAKMWREEGWRGYFRGNGVNVLRIAPYSAVQFTSYEVLKKLLTRGGTESLDTPRRLTAGAIAGICSVVSTYPLDLIRSRMSIASASLGIGAQAVNAKTLGVVGMTKQVYSEGGVRALYRGLVPTAVGVAPYVGINFAAYEFLRSTFSPSDGLGRFLCGAAAGTISQSLTYPLDVLRRRMQVTGMDKVSFKYTGAIDAIGQMIRHEGLRGMYKGLWPNLLKVAPSIGTSFMTYELVKGMLGAD